MIYNLGNIFKEILFKLTFIELYITKMNKNKLYNNNVIAEDFFAGLIFSYS